MVDIIATEVWMIVCVISNKKSFFHQDGVDIYSAETKEDLPSILYNWFQDVTLKKTRYECPESPVSFQGGAGMVTFYICYSRNKELKMQCLCGE